MPDDRPLGVVTEEDLADFGVLPPKLDRSTHPRIAVDGHTNAGQPRIKGTRIPVVLIVGDLSHGVSVDEYVDQHPSVTREDVLAALAYARDVLHLHFLNSDEGRDFTKDVVQRLAAR